MKSLGSSDLIKLKKIIMNLDDLLFNVFEDFTFNLQCFFCMNSKMVPEVLIKFYSLFSTQNEDLDF